MVGVPRRRRTITGTDPQYVTQGQFATLAASLWDTLAKATEQIEELGEKLLSNQDNVDAVTAEVAALDAKVEAAVTAIQAEIADLQSRQVDTSGLEAAVALLSGDVDAVAAIPPVPAPPAE